MDHERAHEFLHTLWSRSQGPEYSKRDWVALQNAIISTTPNVELAASLFERLREIAARQGLVPKNRMDGL